MVKRFQFAAFSRPDLRKSTGPALCLAGNIAVERHESDLAVVLQGASTALAIAQPLEWPTMKIVSAPFPWISSITESYLPCLLKVLTALSAPALAPPVQGKPMNSTRGSCALALRSHTAISCSLA